MIPEFIVTIYESLLTLNLLLTAAIGAIIALGGAFAVGWIVEKLFRRRWRSQANPHGSASIPPMIVGGAAFVSLLAVQMTAIGQAQENRSEQVAGDLERHDDHVLDSAWSSDSLLGSYHLRIDINAEVRDDAMAAILTDEEFTDEYDRIEFVVLDGVEEYGPDNASEAERFRFRSEDLEGIDIDEDNVAHHGNRREGQS